MFEKEAIKEFYQSGIISQCNYHFEYYIDINQYDEIIYVLPSEFEQNQKNINKVKREDEISSDYFFSRKQSTFSYMIGGKQNRLNLSEYQSESKKYKYIPYDDNTNLDYEMKINSVNLIVSNSWGGFVSASVAPTYDYKNNKLQYTESNYQNLCRKSFLQFI